MGCMYPETSRVGTEAALPALGWQHHRVCWGTGQRLSIGWGQPLPTFGPGTTCVLVLKIFEESQSTMALGVGLWEDVMPGSSSLDPVPS